MKRKIIIPLGLFILSLIIFTGCISVELKKSETDKNSATESVIEQDVKKENDLKKISLALEMVYDDDQAYIQSEEMPNKIVSSMGSTYLEEVPTNPDNNNKYYWLDNSSGGTNDDQEYCISTELAEGGYFKCTQDGCEKDVTNCSKNN